MTKLLKFIEYFVEFVEFAKKAYADYRFKKANDQASEGDQRAIEKEINPDEPGPTRFDYPGVRTVKREIKKPD